MSAIFTATRFGRGSKDYDLEDEGDRADYSREIAWHGTVEPTPDHWKLLRRSSWGWDDCEFGAAAMDCKRPYGNSDVTNDLAEILPDRSPEDRLRLHCELRAVLERVCRNGGQS